MDCVYTNVYTSFSLHTKPHLLRRGGSELCSEALVHVHIYTYMCVCVYIYINKSID